MILLQRQVKIWVSEREKWFWHSDSEFKQWCWQMYRFTEPANNETMQYSKVNKE